jgi:hypothetical protein
MIPVIPEGMRWNESPRKPMIAFSTKKDSKGDTAMSFILVAAFLIVLAAGYLGLRSAKSLD